MDTLKKVFTINSFFLIVLVLSASWISSALSDIADDKTLDGTSSLAFALIAIGFLILQDKKNPNISLDFSIIACTMLFVSNNSSIMKVGLLAAVVLIAFVGIKKSHNSTKVQINLVRSFALFSIAMASAKVNTTFGEVVDETFKLVLLMAMQSSLMLIILAWAQHKAYLVKKAIVSEKQAEETKSEAKKSDEDSVEESSDEEKAEEGSYKEPSSEKKADDKPEQKPAEPKAAGLVKTMALKGLVVSTYLLPIFAILAGYVVGGA